MTFSTGLPPIGSIVQVAHPTMACCKEVTVFYKYLGHNEDGAVNLEDANGDIVKIPASYKYCQWK